MSRIIELIEFKNDLEAQLERIPQGLDSYIDEKSVIIKMIQIKHLTSKHDQALLSAIDAIQKLHSQVENVVSDLNQIITQVNSEIDEIANKLYTSPTYKFRFKSDDRITVPCFDDRLDGLIKVRVRQYCDWHYPGIYTNAQDKSFVDCMVVSDPLYLTGSAETVTGIVKSYPEQYQNRVRTYPEITTLPKGQFSFILQWHEFEYLTIDEARDRLAIMFTLLRPGGVLMFSYNNCDKVSSVQLFEEGQLTYNNSRILTTLCQELGYEVISMNDGFSGGASNQWISWAEVKRPGELSTTKAHQALGQIIPK
jgi:hypothetical protein